MPDEIEPVIERVSIPVTPRSAPTSAETRGSQKHALVGAGGAASSG
jgi:hypothetical protein